MALLTPEDIRNRDFLVSLRGFDRAEVRAFLDQVAEQVQDLQGRLEAAEAAETAHGDEVRAAQDAAAGDRDGMPQVFADIGTETQRILEAAQEAATSMARKARVDADREVQSGRRQAARLIAEGEQRREEIETIVAGLEAARNSLSAQLRDIGDTIERVIGELGAPPPPSATVREALTAGIGRPAVEPVRPDPPEVTEPVEVTDPPEVTEPVEEAEDDEESNATDEPVLTRDAEAPPEAEEPVAPDAAQPEELTVVVESEADEPDAPQPDEPHADADAPGAPPAAVEAPAGPGGPDVAGEEPEGPADPADPHGFRAAALSPLHPEFVRAIKRGLQDVQNVALDRLRRTGGEGEPESLLPGDEEVAQLGGAAAGLLEQAYRSGVEVAGVLVDRELPPPTAERDLVGGFLADASARVRSPLAATLRMARSAGDEPPAWLDRVGGVFAELRGTVAEELADTHLMRAYELGLVDAWTAGGVSHRRWVLGREPRCPEARCRQNGLAGVVAMGGTYPSGHEVPPVHVGCRCTTIPTSEPTS